MKKEPNLFSIKNSGRMLEVRLSDFSGTCCLDKYFTRLKCWSWNLTDQTLSFYHLEVILSCVWDLFHQEHKFLLAQAHF